MKSIFVSSRSAESEEHWISVSDLMAGLMILFLFIAITYIRPILEVQGKIREIVVAWKESEADIYSDLQKEFSSDLTRWDAELEEETLTIRFKSPEVLFGSGDATLTSEFRTILQEFFPRYLRILSKYEGAIREIRIEGHTSSEWADGLAEEAAYFNNMGLSQDRTRAVLQYALELPEVAQYRDWILRTVTANGLSSSRLITTDGVEDADRSRRVEFRVETNTKQQIVKILETIEQQ